MTSEPNTAPKTIGFQGFGLVLVFISYLVLVRALRYRRVISLQHRYRHYASGDDLRRMTAYEGWEIVNTIARVEFPTTSLLALQFALFRTYGIPSVSRLLVRTGQLSRPSTCLKRYTDTSVLIYEFFAHPPTSARAHEAIARMNYLHSCYRASGSILDDDMLFTLSLFACQVWEWIDRYEWRKLTNVELCGIGVFFKSVGDAMEISYEKLPSYDPKTGNGFRDGLHWLLEMKDWAKMYEKESMIPDFNNKVIADLTVNILLYEIPSLFRRFSQNAVLYMMDDRLREAMMYPRSSSLCAFVMGIILKLRKWVLRHLFLPRPEFLAMDRSDDDPNADVPHYLHCYEGAPYYVKPTFWRRWGPRAWFRWSMARPAPGDDGLRYHPNGYIIKDVGPVAFHAKGTAYMNSSKNWLATQQTGGCPFAAK